MELDPPRGAFLHGHPFWPKETMALQPLGHRVLIKPDEAPTESQGGLVLPEVADHVSMSGTVVAVGRGSKRLWEVQERLLRKLVANVGDDGSPAVGYVKRLLHELQPIHTVAVGDRVAYPVDAGVQISEDGQ